MSLKTNEASLFIASTGNTNGKTSVTNITQNSTDIGAKTEKPLSALEKTREEKFIPAQNRNYIAWSCTPKDDECTRRGMECLKKNEYDNAIREFEEALKLMPNKPLYHFNLGLAYDGKGELDKAIEQFNIFISHTLKDAHACGYIALGNAYYKKGELVKANEQYNRVIKDKAIIKNDDNLSQCYAGLGNVYDKQDKLNLAIKQYLKAISLNPTVPEYYAKLGDIYFKQGKLERAIWYYELARYRTNDENKKAEYLNIIKNLNNLPKQHKKTLKR